MDRTRITSYNTGARKATHIKTPIFKKREAFTLVAVVIFTGIVMLCAAMAIQTTEMLFNENVISAKRLKIENATTQASALAEEWFRDNVEDIASGRFNISADRAESPEHTPPDALFKILEEEYPDYHFSCTIYDLYYYEKYVDTAYEKMLPFIPPTETDDGEIELAYIQSVTVDPGNSDSQYTRTTSLRVVKDTSGDIRVVVVGSSESS